MKLWGGRFEKKTDGLVDDFHSSITFDQRLYHQDIAGSVAHATMLGAQGIIPKAAVAKKAIPNCHIVFVTGEEMKTQIAPFFQILFNANPKSVGGTLPADDFYFVK